MFRLCRKSEGHLPSRLCDVPFTSTSSIHLLCYSARLFTTDCRCNHNLSVPLSCSRVFKPPQPFSALKTRVLFIGMRKNTPAYKINIQHFILLPSSSNAQNIQIVYFRFIDDKLPYTPVLYYHTRFYNLLLKNRKQIWVFGCFGLGFSCECVFLKDIH